MGLQHITELLMFGIVEDPLFYIEDRIPYTTKMLALIRCIIPNRSLDRLVTTGYYRGGTKIYLFRLL